MGRINELRLISRVAQMYYSEHKRQAEIAEHLHLSQATVSRMLKRAEAEGIVRTSIIPPVGTFNDLETRLRERFDVPLWWIAARIAMARSWRASVRQRPTFWK